MALVSIITIVKDHVSGLRDTFSSLIDQKYDDWEMLIVVGMSTDSTVQTARKIETEDTRVKVIQQTGLGIYSAMNEGIQGASGEFLWFMNAGDKFASADVLGNALIEISGADVGLVIGGYRIEGRKDGTDYSYPRKDITTFDFAFNRRTGCHQAMIFRTNLLKSAGGFNTNYSLASDFELVLRIIKSNGAIRVPQVYASVESGGVADQSIFLVHQQKHRIRKEFFRSVVVTMFSLAWTLAARIKITLRRVFQG